MARKATVYDVAERAGVSIATVSFVYSKPERVKTQTIAAVKAAADELGYVPSQAARGLARGRTGAIGIYSFDYMLDDGDREDESQPVPSGRLFPLYADEVQRGVQVECHRRGLALMLGGTRTSTPDSRVIEVAGRVDGLISFAGAVSTPALKQVASRIPVVVLGGEASAPGTRTVFVDNYSGMADLMRHLLDVHDHRTFAYFGEVGTPEFRQRYDAFRDLLGARGLAASEPITTRTGFDETARQAVADLRDRLPDAIVCDSDQTALATIDALRDIGVRVPEDVAVTGFDGLLAARVAPVPLTTVRQPMSAVGRLAVRMLEDMMEGREAEDPGTPLACTLLIGASCGCVAVEA